ncbi:MAG: undecaprenyl-diphosphatase UppP [candidate division NC10 bacterium]|nr:undecaprenyl-diphosphatase UppP [candidate division NC10 bacterium]
MSTGQAAFLGLIQGLTEFLPISSIAHLRVIPALLGWPDPGAPLSAVLQLGTLVAVLLYFERDLRGLSREAISSLLRGRPLESVEARLAWFILIGTLPIACAGLLFENMIKGEARSLSVIASSLVGLALLLWIAEGVGVRRIQMEQVGFLRSQAIGLAQSLALIPGASRSGVTITAGLFAGMTRAAATRFSFLLGIPAILASGVYELKALVAGGIQEIGWGSLCLGLVAAGVSGYVAIDFLLKYLERHTTYVFIWYRIGLGLLLWALILSGVLAA